MLVNQKQKKIGVNYSIGNTLTSESPLKVIQKYQNIKKIESYD